MEIARGSVGADLCIGPWACSGRGRVRADTWVRPYAEWKAFRTNGKLARRRTLPTGGAGVDRRRGVVTPPYGCNTGDAKQRADVGIGPYALCGTPGSSCPTGGCGEPPRLPWVAAHSGAFALRMGGMGGSRSRDHSKSAYQRRTIPRLAYGCQLPLHKGAMGDGGCGSPRRFAPCTDSPTPLSFRGGPTGRRGNPSFLRWTGVRAAEVVGPYGKPDPPPKPAGAQRSVRARGRKGWAGIDARTIPKRGTAPATA